MQTSLRCRHTVLSVWLCRVIFADRNSKLLREEFQQFLSPNLAHSRQRGNLYTQRLPVLVQFPQTKQEIALVPASSKQHTACCSGLHGHLMNQDSRAKGLPEPSGPDPVAQMRTEVQNDSSLAITPCASGRVGSGVALCLT